MYMQSHPYLVAKGYGLHHRLFPGVLDWITSGGPFQSASSMIHSTLHYSGDQRLQNTNGEGARGLCSGFWGEVQAHALAARAALGEARVQHRIFISVADSFFYLLIKRRYSAVKIPGAKIH